MDQPSSTHLQEGTQGFSVALATAVGLIIASSVLLTATTGFGAAGSTFALAVVIAYILMMAQSASFAEASGILPTAGSVYDYVASGLGRFLAVTGTFAAYFIVHVFAGTAETATAGEFAKVNFSFLENLDATWIIGVALLGIFAVVNMLGIDLYGRFEVAMTAFMLATLLIFGLIGTLKGASSGIDGFFGAGIPDASLTDILTFVGLAMFLFVGVEYVTPLATELKDAKNSVPKAMYLGVTLVAVSMFLYGAGMARQVSNAEGALFGFDSVPKFADEILGGFGKFWLGAAVLLASAATINTLLAGVPRIMYGMAKDGTLPAVFAWLHPKYKTPWIAIAPVAIIPAVYSIYIDGDVPSIFTNILAAVCAWVFSYILVNLSVVALRIRRPDLDRPYKTPLYPLPQIIATIGMLITLWYIAPPGITRAEIYKPFGVMLALSAVYAVVWLTLNKKPLFTPVEPEALLEAERA